ncbi:hypothetical protein TWF281_001294 [Arthrobotrys megalospora]
MSEGRFASLAEREDEALIRFGIFVVFAVKQLLLSLAAGPAAVAMGAHANGSPLTDTMLKIGFIASVTKAGMEAFVGFVACGGRKVAVLLIVALLFTTTGMAILITAQVSQMVLGEIQKELIIAAAVASIPLMVDIQLTCGIDLTPLTKIGMTALAGYVFVRMGNNQGIHICSYHAAMSAGAVYATVFAPVDLVLGTLIAAETESQTTSVDYY